jgi:calcineurin-like phosphoesterase family protein
MNNIWLTSDTHYNHSNYCLGVSNWDNKEVSCRKFQTLEEMNQLLVNNINQYVKENDTLYHLGDWSFGGIDNIWEFRKQINCKNIILVPGNHDHHVKNNKILPNCSWYPNKSFIFNSMSYYQTGKNTSVDEYIVKAQDLFKDVLPQCYKLQIDKSTNLILSHYPIEEWEDMDKGSIHCHGHSHHSKDNTEISLKYRRMDVGIDWKDFRPYHLDEILILKLKEIRKRYENG